MGKALMLCGAAAGGALALRALLRALPESPLALLGGALALLQLLRAERRAC